MTKRVTSIGENTLFSTFSCIFFTSGDEWVTSNLKIDKIPIQFIPCKLFDDSDKMVTSMLMTIPCTFGCDGAKTPS